jgi:DNA-binding NtrC family response regulator
VTEGVTILVVDDEPEILDIIAHMLEGNRVLRALNVTEAREHFSREKCSLVITDMKMPGSSGASLITHLKESESTVPIIVITGHGVSEGPDSAHVFRWIRKPFRRMALLEAVHAALGR